MSLHGSSTSLQTLSDARIEETDLVVAVTSNEAVNLTTAMLAKKMGSRLTISRVSNEEYIDDKNLDMIKSLGIDYLIYPEDLAAKELLN